MEEKKLYANVAVDIPSIKSKGKSYYYYVPEGLDEKVKVGSVVHIPFGSQEVNGYVLSVTDSVDTSVKCKSLLGMSTEFSIWDEKFISLAKWISEYYLTNIGTVLASTISSEVLRGFSHEARLLMAREDLPSLSVEESFVVNKLLNSKNKHKKLSYKSLKEKARFSKSKFYQVISALKNKGVVEVSINHKKISSKKTSEYYFPPVVDTDGDKNIVLNEEQEIVLSKINIDQYQKYLLHGVTGSGKTEIYLRLIESVLKKGKRAIYLLPEIYLVPQAYERLKKKFDPKSILIWHSSLSKSQRLSNWNRLMGEGEDVKIILGARSAILSPIKDLGLVIIDEAHESTYKQNSPAPRYETVRVANKRCELEGCPLVLGTATPNISDYYEAKENNTLVELTKRIEEKPMPLVNLIDLKCEKSYNKILSNELRLNIEAALSKKEQIVLLLNRRGYSNNILCKACGYSLLCKNCSVPMVYHKNLSSVICHHCGHSKKYRETDLTNSPCPDCNSDHLYHFGLGTQQLEEEVKALFPDAKAIRVDTDNLKKKEEYLKSWNDFASGDADILIGTQLVAKGLDLPNVTLVGVVSADSMLSFPDYVSYERAFQLITQVSGRAGRGDKLGKVFIQGYKVDEEIFNFVKSHDYKSFYEREISSRKEHSYPPFVLLNRIIFQSHNEKECLNFAEAILEKLNKYPAVKDESHIQLLGPAPCFFSKIQGKYRYHILCKLSDEKSKQDLFAYIDEDLTKNKDVEVIVDVDSVNLL